MDLPKFKVKTKSAVKTLKKSKGETLIEVIVSLVVILILLASVTSILQTSIAFLSAARENSIEMEQASKNIEGANHSGEKSTANIKISYAGKQIDIPLTSEKQSPFIYFYKK